MADDDDDDDGDRGDVQAGLAGVVVIMDGGDRVMMVMIEGDDDGDTGVMMTMVILE